MGFQQFDMTYLCVLKFVLILLGDHRPFFFFFKFVGLIVFVQFENHLQFLFFSVLCFSGTLIYIH